MAGRPREFDEKEARDAAMQLFWTRGYEATSLSDLLLAMGVSKSTFYQTFESKHALFENCLVRYGEILITAMREGLSTAPKAIDFIRSALTDIAKETRDPAGRRGCLMANTAAEFAQSDPQIARCVKAGMEASREVFIEAIVAAQADGDISADAIPKVLADYLVTSYIGLKTQVKAGASANQIRNIAELFVAALQRLV
ncbi:MAG: TetR/AcrR family transcriptional repressor of nem operon [Pseudohongiellaceae bacterium]|jgi:TetR/AcrR family transcriptional repressor of nem operon